MKISKIALYTTALAMMGSTATLANDMAKGERAIANLPESGGVTVHGTIDDVKDRETFVLRDNAGDTIDVHTANALGCA